VRAVRALLLLALLFVPVAAQAGVSPELVEALRQEGLLDDAGAEAVLKRLRQETGQDLPPPAAKEIELQARAREGVYFQSEDKAFTIHPGGRVYLDWAAVSADSAAKNAAGEGFGTEFRALSLQRIGSRCVIGHLWRQSAVG
jgi:hypothetical protein